MKKSYIVGIFAGVLLLIFFFAYFGLGMKRYFGPKHENVRREIFENTKSYSHGKTQELAVYYEEYAKAQSEEDRQAVAALIRMQFADYDIAKLNSARLRNFLTQARGY